MRGILLAVVVGGSLGLAQTASAALGYFEGFEDQGWTQGSPSWVNYGGNTIEQAASGTNGITSSQGGYHAILQPLGTNNNVFNVPTLGANSPYSTLGGYESSFGTGFVVSLDIYLDPQAWIAAPGTGFDYSAAANNQTSDHLRDFIFHVGVLNGELLVNATNNSDLSFNGGKLTLGGTGFAVADAGWYTFEHVFYDNGGTLAVDFNLYDDSAALLNTWTRTTADDIASTVGGNRYAWFTYNNIEGLAIDNSSVNGLPLQTVVPEPATAALGLMGLAGLAMAARRRRAA